MFCPKCGTQNNDNNINCVNCGAPLSPNQQQQGYAQPQYGYAQPQYGYTQPQPVNALNGPKPNALYIIAGVMAALQVLMFFLPHLSSKGGKVFMPVQLFGGAKALDSIGAKDASSIVGGFMFFFVIVVGLEIAWAILSFLKKRPAGIFGVVASAVGFFVHMIWMIAMGAASSPTYVTMLPFPIFMFFLSIAGIPVSIVQIVKKKYY